MTERIGR